MKISTVLIEDEQNALDHLKALLADFCPNIELAGTANSVASGVAILRECNPQLIIADIELPDGTTFDILNQIPDFSFNIIFITAHSEYAIKAFKISAIDYLLKPIDIDELIAATNKAEEQMSHQSLEARIKALLGNLSRADYQDKKIVLTYNHVFHVINITDIIFCQSEVNYTNFYLRDNRQILSSKNVSEFEEMLNEHGFFRANRQYLINVKHIVSFNKTPCGYVSMVNGYEIPVSFRRRDLLVELISKL
ncbi:MAG: response regulator transcription factor [Bacteroidales bacterium]|nr:response regulator transcription factor [Bacteroidales bacterium]